MDGNNLRRTSYATEHTDRAYHLQIKKYRIMSDIFRNRLRKYNGISDIVTGLVNYRTMNNYHY